VDKRTSCGDALDSKHVTAFTRDAWQTMRKYYDKSYSDGVSDRYNLFPLHLPAMPQFRKIARIKGKATLTDNQHGKYFADSIGLYADWRKPGFVWETPFRTLVPEKISGVFAAGRCMSTDGEREVYRVIPSAAMTGEAAGVAAALTVENKCETYEIKASQVQDELRKNNFKFHLAEVGL
jgi:hypothetical protein